MRTYIFEKETRKFKKADWINIDCTIYFIYQILIIRKKAYDQGILKFSREIGGDDEVLVKILSY